MMKSLLFGALALLICASCSNEENSAESIQEEGTLKVELKLTAAADADTRTDYISSTEAERTVKTLDAYLFAPDATGKEYILEKRYDNLLAGDWTPGAQEETKIVSLPNVERTAKKIFFVANGGGITSLSGVSAGTTTEAAFRALLMNVLTASPDVTVNTPLVMTAETALEATAWSSNPLSVTVSGVTLERVVARIDLVVAPQEGVAFIPTKIEMEKARACSFIFPASGTYGGGNSTLTLTKEITATDKTATASTAYKSLLFPYEAPAADDVKLMVTGKLTVNGKTVTTVLDIPFADAETNALAVERNTCYTVTITRINGLPAKADVTFTVKEWEKADEVELPVQVDNFSVTGEGLVGNRLALGGASNQSKALTVTTNVAWNATVTVGSDFLTATADGNQLTVTAKSANETGLPRIAYVVLSTTADPNVSYTLVVTQAVFKNLD